MEAAIRIIPSAAVGAANIWLVWLSLVFLQAEAADSAQADLDFFYILVRAGVPITVFSVAVVLGTYLSKEEGAKYPL